MAGYFLFITLILIVTLTIFFIHWVTNKLRKEKKTFLNKLGGPLIEEIQLEEQNLKRAILNRMYTNVNAINEIINSNELYVYLNPLDINIINEEYQLMRLKYRRLKNKIEDKILKLDAHFYSNRNSIALSDFVFINHRIAARGLQKELPQIKSNFNTQAHLRKKSDKLTTDLENNSNNRLENSNLESPHNNDHPQQLLHRSQTNTDYYVVNYALSNLVSLLRNKTSVHL